MDHDKFFDGLLDYVYNHPERYKASEVDWVNFNPGQEIILCQEPLTFLGKLDDYSNNQGRCRAEFKKLLNCNAFKIRYAIRVAAAAPL